MYIVQRGREEKGMLYTARKGERGPTCTENRNMYKRKGGMYERKRKGGGHVRRGREDERTNTERKGYRGMFTERRDILR